MEKKSKKKVMAIVAALVIVVLVSVQGIILLLQKRQAGSQELSKIANAESEEILADAYEDVSGNEKINPSSEKKKEIMDELSKSWDKTKVDEVEVPISETDQTKVKVPVPKGYTASKVTGKDGEKGENTLDGGLVIYEGDEEVTGEFGSEQVKQAQKERNQWVWVPVYDSSDVYGTDTSGKMWGKLYDFNASGRKKYNWTEDNNGVITISDPTYYREPDLISSYDTDVYLPGYLLEKEREELEKELTTNFEKTINSIKKYGGFYIGRYETGALSGEAKVVKQNEDITDQDWYTMYEKSKSLKGKNKNVETSMIWGCLWDATLQWFVDTEAATYSDVGNDSSSWGNYYDQRFQYEDSSGNTVQKKTRKKIPTGSSDHNKKNNIYDMAGNINELTLEDYNDRVSRGGEFRRQR